MLNIVQTFLNEAVLYDTIIQLPTNMNLIGAIMTIAMNSKFKYLEENLKIIRERLPEYAEQIGGEFDIKKVWSGKLYWEWFFSVLYSLTPRLS